MIKKLIEGETGGQKIDLENLALLVEDDKDSESESENLSNQLF